jgi:hypothetical protein
MALGDVQHVEAVSIIRRLVDYSQDPEGLVAARAWLEENHPSPEAYVAAARTVGLKAEPEEMGV